MKFADVAERIRREGGEHSGRILPVPPSGEWVAATDGHSLVGARGEAMEPAGPPLHDADALRRVMFDREPREQRQLSVAELAAWCDYVGDLWSSEPEKCGECNGTGRAECECPDCTGGCDCVECDGVGTFEARRPERPGVLLGMLLNRILLGRVLLAFDPALPVMVQRLDGSILRLIQGEARIGVVMGMHGRKEDHPEFPATEVSP